MTENTCEHEWDESEDIDNFFDLVDLTRSLFRSGSMLQVWKIGQSVLRQNGAQFSGCNILTGVRANQGRNKNILKHVLSII